MILIMKMFFVTSLSHEIVLNFSSSFVSHNVKEKQMNNLIQDCFYDWDDCCGSCVNTESCTECFCNGNLTGNGFSNHLIANGVCNDDMNIFDCAYDGFDCCGSNVSIKHCVECNCHGRYWSQIRIMGDTSLGGTLIKTFIKILEYMFEIHAFSFHRKLCKILNHCVS